MIRFFRAALLPPSRPGQAPSRLFNHTLVARLASHYIPLHPWVDPGRHPSPVRPSPLVPIIMARTLHPCRPSTSSGTPIPCAINARINQILAARFNATASYTNPEPRPPPPLTLSLSREKKLYKLCPCYSKGGREPVLTLAIQYYNSSSIEKIAETIVILPHLYNLYC